MCRITIKSYYKHFLSLYGVLAAAIGGLPLLSKLLPEDWAQYVFPPLGAWSPFYRVAALVLAASITLLVYFSKEKLYVNSKRRRTKALRLRITIAIIGVIAFLMLTQKFVRSIPIPSIDKSIVVSVSYERTEFARSNFPNATDEEMLRARGATEEEIWRLWTSQSIIVARSALFVTYLICILSAVSCFSLGVLFDKCGSPENP